MNPDLIILVIDSDSEEVYRIGKEIWRINAYNNGIKIYFLNSNDDISDEIPYIDGDTINTPKSDNLHRDINYKTVDAIRYCINEYDFKFILRTNLSSFFRLDLLEKYIESLNISNVYAGSIEYFPLNSNENTVNLLSFCSGSGYIVSRDVAEKIVNRSTDLAYELNDDVCTGLKLVDIPRTIFQRVDFCDINKIDLDNFRKIQKRLDEAESTGTFHFRIKNIFEMGRVELDSWVLLAVLNRTIGWGSTISNRS